MKKIKPIAVLAIYLTVQNLIGQDPVSEYIDHYSNVVPETPNAASFGAYGNTVLSYSTGQPTISIPIYTVQKDGVSIPIFISYDASGIRVDEMASVVGLKWRLSAGGLISRTINNVPDENGWVSANWSSLEDSWYAAHPVSNYTTQDYITSNQDKIDHSPDDFSYSLPGYSGSFVFERKNVNSIWKEKNDNLSIVANTNVQVITDFTVRDVQGNTYTFGDDIANRETNSNNVISGSGNGIGITPVSYTSSWMLADIATKNGKNISFDYEDYDMTYILYHRSHTIVKGVLDPNPDGVDECAFLEPMAGAYNAGAYTFRKTTTSVMNSPKNKLVSKISTDTEEVLFTYADHTPATMPEGDAIWGKKLALVTIVDKVNNDTIKKVHFEYDTCPGDPRLRLKEVYEEDADGNQKPPYVFTYNEDYSLPDKKSYDRDYFGYYNGAGNTSLLIPFSAHGYSNLPMILKKDLADRRPSLEHLVSGNLIGIQYPTGGKTSFEYELNTEDNGYGEIKYLEDGFELSTATSSYTLSGGIRRYTVNFTIPDYILGFLTYVGGNTSNILIDADSSGNCGSNLPDLPNACSTGCPGYKIYENGNPTPIQTKVISSNLSSTSLSPGQYSLVMEAYNVDFTNIPNFEGHVSFKWYYQEKDGLGNYIREPQYAGGLRVKRTVDIDADNKEYYDTSYTYSGLTGQNWEEQYVFETSGRWTASSESVIHKRFQKSGYFYQEVTETKKVGESGTYPFIINETFTNEYHFEDDYLNYSYSGKPSKTFLYDRDGRLLSKTFYIYDSGNQIHYFNILGKTDYCYQGGGPYSLIGYNQPESAFYKEYYSYLTKEVSTQYFYEGSGTTISGKATNVKEYTYNGDDLVTSSKVDTQLTETSNLDYYNSSNYTTDIKGNILTTNFTYPKNHLSETLFSNFVNNKYLLGVPVSIKVYDGTTLINGNYFEYDTAGNINRLYRYNKGQVSNSSSYAYIPSDYELDRTFNTFEGKPIEVYSQENGMYTAYLWNSARTYLLAKVENATYTEVTNLVAAGSTGYSALTTVQENTLRSNLPGALVTTYTYDPLVGVTSITDPRGQTVYYGYDGFGRLKRAKDADGKILEEYNYHYKDED